MELLIFLGLIVMALLAVTSENLPPPHLSLMTSGTIYMGDTVELQCAAPTNHPEGTFYLYLNSTGQCLQQKAAPETKNIVKFTISSPYTMKSMEYSCMYKSYVGSELQLSEVSNVLSLTVNVPVWVFVLVGLVGLLILVAAVLVTYLVRRSKKKKKEQRDKESIWIAQDMTKEWPTGSDNMVYNSNSTSDIDTSHDYPGNMDSRTYSGSFSPFSTFRAP
ncbi:protein HIDE1 isoform X1 [Ranitomeya variabilis]|uniref:protein HIDE1 isoform X1 n=3 Tax=Ranitomeya variabilis TaxID=490064 RepID=UPI0040579DDE